MQPFQQRHTTVSYYGRTGQLGLVTDSAVLCQETKRQDTKRQETKRQETKRQETKRQETKRQETKRQETNSK